jgi:hypothetical protein
MSFQLATTMHEHYYQREAVNFFLLCSSIYPRPRMHVIGQVLQSIFFHYVTGHLGQECSYMVVDSWKHIIKI